LRQASGGRLRRFAVVERLFVELVLSR